MSHVKYPFASNAGKCLTLDTYRRPAVLAISSALISSTLIDEYQLIAGKLEAVPDPFTPKIFIPLNRTTPSNLP
jgi:hypothetical protein